MYEGSFRLDISNLLNKTNFQGVPQKIKYRSKLFPTNAQRSE